MLEEGNYPLAYLSDTSPALADVLPNGNFMPVPKFKSRIWLADTS